MSVAAEPVNTKKAEGRRQVRYESWDDLLADAKAHAEGSVRRLGNWSPGQIYEHLARAIDGSIDGFDFSFPAPLRWVMSLLMKRKFLEKNIPAGFNAPNSQIPDATPAAEGLASLEKAVARQKNETNRVMHPGFGNLTRDEWTKFHLRHAEMHMSFLKKDNG